MAYHLFEVFGIELEYMLVKNQQLKVAPIVDQLMVAKMGYVTADADNGPIEWSNELVAHVVELKTNGPTPNLKNLSKIFHKNVIEINNLLKPLEARLLPTASHPLMDPKTEMQLWKHSYSEIYALYNRIFNCKGHGWSNVQSMHINLPFYDDAEFEKLHAAVRVLLPIIPALSASSPIFDGKNTGFLDSRMEVYKTNQKEIPQMTGKVIPEQVFSKEAYYETIFNPINKAIKPFDTEDILDHHFLNSRGAIARFDRNAIEIRVIDIQECPLADVAIAALIIEVLKILVSEKLTPLETQKSFHENELLTILNGVIKLGENAVITDKEYLQLFGIKDEVVVSEIWKSLFEKVKGNLTSKYQKTIKAILANGSLSTRILKTLGNDFSEKNILKVYNELADCLQENKLFLP
jgi:carboxylate-amine ligase